MYKIKRKNTLEIKKRKKGIDIIKIVMYNNICSLQNEYLSTVAQLVVASDWSSEGRRFESYLWSWSSTQEAEEAPLLRV